MVPKGAYVLLGEKFDLKNQTKKIEIYVGGSHKDADRRICTYYQSISKEDSRPVNRYIREFGIDSMKIIFFKICESNSEKPISREAASEL
jgi:hypothetical protein